MRNALLDSVNTGTLDEFLLGLTCEELQFIFHDWQIWARDDQLPPDKAANGKPWTTWLILGGRGAGKTRAGAEWVRALALGKQPFAHEPIGRIALIGETLADVRSVMIEGVSGLLAIHPDNERPDFTSSKRQLVWPNGAVAQIYSADDPESLRGPQFGAAWCDELGKWRYADACWDMLQFGLRLGIQPRQVVTTTPRPIAILRNLLEDPSTVVSRAATQANAPNLAPAFLDTIVARYRNTWLGRQELNAEILENSDDALWTRGLIERHRGDAPSEFARIVVTVDPPVTSGQEADACGIVVVGLGQDERAYVLDDATVEAARPTHWARAATAAYHDHKADCLLAEVNQGGELIACVIRQVDPTVPVNTVRATRGKWLRAEPVAALYEQGRVVHCGAFPKLEDQMCNFERTGFSRGKSPDRVDALVWAVTELLLRRISTPRVHSI